ncbi:UDP-N-acetylmuramate dehydrogenase [Cryobacterium tepidiphilum]|uniref:UDP-N-acetylenolpyruvoylglucosamine reductase n=1 Tax=Cryobacterium tepidiphilum TaxID=2486026 RepID=A0A3M8KUA1_9MICO|nr:UDP-N-acetylmuramate dehydrogenase [Cryobacterium tepidiphilum]RNE56645.1 UDP-N-acetylmuramate dehydrogenase [Cryobacterium tepidiphilum]
MTNSSVTPVALSELTTMRVGGVPAAMLEPGSEQGLVDAALAVWADGGEWMLLGGGSNTVAADEGFDGTVIRVVTQGIERLPADGATDAAVRLRVQAGESWDGLVAHAVEQGWSGIEALSGIPGSVGAAPVQNIGAYGQELASSLVAIDFLEEESGELRRMEAAELALGYRTSALKQGLRGVVVAVELQLREALASADGTPLGEPVAYPQLAGALGVQQGDRVPLADVRQSVLALRASKGMVLDAADSDTWSAGSFFTNPIVTEGFARALPASAPRWPLGRELPDRVIPLEEYAGVGPVPGADNPMLVKLSAAWLIEAAGIARGFRLPGSRAAISSKHTLALTNTGGATADEVGQLARFVQGRVAAEFGIILQPEPVLVGLTL